MWGVWSYLHGHSCVQWFRSNDSNVSGCSSWIKKYFAAAAYDGKKAESAESMLASVSGFRFRFRHPTVRRSSYGLKLQSCRVSHYHKPIAWQVHLNQWVVRSHFSSAAPTRGKDSTKKLGHGNISTCIPLSGSPSNMEHATILPNCTGGWIDLWSGSNYIRLDSYSWARRPYRCTLIDLHTFLWKLPLVYWPERLLWDQPCPSMKLRLCRMSNYVPYFKGTSLLIPKPLH